MPFYAIEMAYKGRTETGWFMLTAKDIFACVRDIPNHNPDGQVVRVEEVTAEQAAHVDDECFLRGAVVFTCPGDEIIRQIDERGRPRAIDIP
jgi:hypothetical protein